MHNQMTEFDALPFSIAARRVASEWFEPCAFFMSRRRRRESSSQMSSFQYTRWLYTNTAQHCSILCIVRKIRHWYQIARRLQTLLSSTWKQSGPHVFLILPVPSRFHTRTKLDSPVTPAQEVNNLPEALTKQICNWQLNLKPLYPPLDCAFNTSLLHPTPSIFHFKISSRQ